jgi:hypothetical protein
MAPTGAVLPVAVRPTGHRETVAHNLCDRKPFIYKDIGGRWRTIHTHFSPYFREFIQGFPYGEHSSARCAVSRPRLLDGIK